jgi:hypothetical protein
VVSRPRHVLRRHGLLEPQQVAGARWRAVRLGGRGDLTVGRGGHRFLNVAVWFYRGYLRRSVLTFLVLGVVPLLGGLYMGATFFYGLTTQSTVVAVVAVASVALSFAVGALVVWRASPSSPFFAEFEKRRQSDRMGDRRGGVRRQPAGGRASGLNLGQLYFQPDRDHGTS